MKTSSMPVKRMAECALIALLAVVSAGQASAAGGAASLVEAAKQGDAAAVRAFLKKQPSSVNVAEGDGTTALHWAADHNDAATSDLLIRAGANVKAVNRYGATPLYSAAVNGNAAIIDQLLKAGADANTALPEGETTLMTAARTGNVDAVKLLLECGADVNAKEGWKQQTALMWAAHEGNAAAAKLLIGAGAYPGPSLFGWTRCCSRCVRDLDTIKTLLAAGASVHDTARRKEPWSCHSQPEFRGCRGAARQQDRSTPRTGLDRPRRSCGLTRRGWRNPTRLHEATW